MAPGFRHLVSSSAAKNRNEIYWVFEAVPNWFGTDTAQFQLASEAEESRAIIEPCHSNQSGDQRMYPVGDLYVEAHENARGERQETSGNNAGAGNGGIIASLAEVAVGLSVFAVVGTVKATPKILRFVGSALGTLADKMEK